MRFLSVRYRIVLGLVSIVMSTMLLVIFGGFGPDARQASMRGRKHLCESIAINSSIHISQNDVQSIERSLLAAIIERDEELLSAGIRRADGQMIATVGEHSKWVAEDEKSTETQLLVPLFSGSQRWGTVELRFQPVSSAGISRSRQE